MAKKTADEQVKPQAPSPVRMRVQQIAKRHGIGLGRGVGYTHAQSTMAVETLLRVWRTFGEAVLDETLRIVKEGANNRRGMYGSTIISGVALLVAQYGKDLDSDRLIAVLKDTPPATLVERARMRNAIDGRIPVRFAMALHLRMLYNRSRPASKLPYWTQRSRIPMIAMGEEDRAA